MADFSKAAVKLLVDEGGFSDHPDDPGGATSYGISQRWLDKMGFDVKAKDVTKDQALGWYSAYWWDEYRYGDFEDQDLADELLSMSVVSGPAAAHRCLQRAVCAVKSNPDEIQEDGILGPVTRRKVSEIVAMGRSCCLRASYRSEQAGYLRDLDNATMEKGWVRRAYR